MKDLKPFGERRARLLTAMHPGVLVLFSTPTALRNNDVEHEYRQSSDFFYLTGYDEPDSALVLSSVAEKQPFVLFVRPRDPERETWDGRRAGIEGAVQEFGADVAYPIAELAQRLPELLLGASELHCAIGRHRQHDDALLSALEGARRRGRRGATYPTRLVDAEVLLHEKRLFKQPEELEIMRRAARISGEAHLAAMKAAGPGVNECEIDALFRGIFRRNGCERPAYEPIVGSGPNATILHYRRNNRVMQDGELLLIDAGCELDYYASDVTRTFPVNGRFSPEQRVIYEIVLSAQQRAIDKAKTGATLDDVHLTSAEVISAGLIELGLLKGPLDEALSEQRYKTYYMHKCSHWLGMDVHDVGAYCDSGKGRPLAPGMVLTVEPGIYISEHATGPAERYRGIGVRIEDDVLVTESGNEVLTEHIPRTVDALERACQS
ncbi:MAG TPA: aminopeptidase P N-terminal domain-containing protein [Polyangiaceae bacterium]|nr:aminopeptidase P N-terminal domain-containing protein [Polyangiaceae bacterium]